MTATSVLDVDVRARFGSFRLNATFTSGPGVTAIFGPSGCGKTSLINVLAGLVRPERGRIAVDGKILFDSSANVNLPPRQRRLGYVFQDGRLFPHLSVRSNLTYGMRWVPKPDRHQDFDHIVQLLNLDTLLARQPRTLSGGEKQRVAIGRALLASPRLLLMDEPLASLDVVQKAEILPFIERLRDELRLPIAFVSHSVEEVVRLADTLVILSEGNTVQYGPVEDVMSRIDLPQVADLYEAGAVVPVIVDGHDEVFELTRLSFAGGTLMVPRLRMPAGTRLRVRIRARDVALSLARPEGTSVLNILDGCIAKIGDTGGSQVDVLVDVGCPIIARITRKSLHDLDIKPDQPVFALVKAVAVDRSNIDLGKDADGVKTRVG